MDIKIDKSQWSISSQKSSGGHYDLEAKYYEGIAISCSKCACSFVCTAEEQKEAYEIHKKFVWWLPSRCSKCQKELDTLLLQDSNIQQLWNADKESVKADSILMKKWLHVIKDIQSYGKCTNQSMISCLLKCLHET
jgi:hypothetical protein